MRFSFSIIALSIGFLQSCNAEKEDKLTIACAANFEATADSLLSIFEKNTQVETELIVSASGTITAQIESGAPYDVFISANQAYTQDLYDQQLLSKPERFAVGHLVFVYPHAHNFERLDDYLMSDKVGKIAIADPEIAPFGLAAKEYLTGIRLYDSLEHKIVIGENIGQVNQFFSSGAVDVVFTSNSFVHQLTADEDAVHIYSGYNHVYHSAGIVESEDKESMKHAEKFMDFLLSSESSKILEYFGYSTN